MRVFGVFACAGVALGLGFGSARAAEPSSVDYTAPPSCPDRDAFVAELHARTDAFTESANAPRKFIVRIAEHDSRIRGSLAIERSGRAGTARSLEAKTCAEAVRALSFMVALVLDPDAKAPPPPPAPPPPHEQRSPDAADTNDDAPPTRIADADADAPSAPPSPLSPEKTPLEHDDTGPASARRALRWSARVSADGSGMGAPGVVFGGGVGVAVQPADWLDLRASFHRTFATTVTTEPTSSDFTWTFGRIQSCLDLARMGRLDAGPCVHFDVGQLAAQGGGVRQSESPNRLWLAGGLDAFAQVALADPVMIELSAGLFTPFERTEFAYEPTFVVYRPPAVGAQASLGVGVRWR